MDAGSTSHVDLTAPPVAAPPTVPPRRGVVAGARMALVMLLLAGVAMLALGVVALAASDPAPIEGWLREVFGEVFGRFALVVGGAIALPAAMGMWTMAGARREGAVTALGPGARRVTVALGIGAVLTMAAVVVVRGNGLSIVDLGLVGLIGLLAFGLTGAATLSAHRNRAIVCFILLALVLLGAVRILVAVIGTSAG